MAGPEKAEGKAPKKGRRLCRLADIPDGGSNGFASETTDGRLQYLAVRLGDAVFVYINACPHTGMPLDFQPGRFLNPDGTLIQCSSHGAEFRIEDGYCVVGPCAGDSLEPVGTKIRGGTVYVTG